jgi:preprotein translocase subunit SecE
MESDIMAKKEKEAVKKAKKVKEENKPKKESFLKGIASEFKKIRWPNKKEMVKYSTATIIFVLFFGVFFYLIEVAMYFIEKMI